MVHLVIAGDLAACRFERVSQQRLDSIVAILIALLPGAVWDDSWRIFVVDTPGYASLLVEFLAKRFRSDRIFIKSLPLQPETFDC